jgi:hypothetical protein
MKHGRAWIIELASGSFSRLNLIRCLNTLSLALENAHNDLLWYIMPEGYAGDAVFDSLSVV